MRGDGPMIRAGGSVNDASSPREELKSMKAIGVSAPVRSHLYSAQLASAVSTACFYPFDVLRTRFMSQDGTSVRQHNGTTYHSVRRSLRMIYRQEGHRSLFRGLPVALIGAITAWGMYMGCYRLFCNWTEVTSFYGRALVSMVASSISTITVCPIFLIKSRMQLEESKMGGHTHYKTFRSGIRHAVQNGGFRTLWRGGSLHLWLVIPHSLNLPIYDFLKYYMLSYHQWKREPSMSADYSLDLAEVICCSTITKVLVLLLSHPMMVIRVRLQDQRSHQGSIQYRSVAQAVRTTLKLQGVRGMYRGFKSSLIHTLPRSVLHYIIYEYSLNLMIANRV